MGSTSAYVLGQDRLVTEEIRRSRQFWCLSLVLKALGPALLVVGMIKAFNLSGTSLLINLSQLFGAANWIYNDLHWLWVVVPYPNLRVQSTPEHPFAPVISMFGWAIWGWGLVLLGAAASTRSKHLGDTSKKRRERVDLQRVMLHMHSNPQNNVHVGGDVYGDVSASNVYGADTQEHNTFWVTPIGLIVIGLIGSAGGNLVSDFIKWIMSLFAK